MNANFNLNVSWQAEAVRVALAGLHEPCLQERISDQLTIKVNQLVNGREQGYCLHVYGSFNPSEESLYIFFAEARGSDSLFVQHVKAPFQGNGGRLEDFTPESYETRKVLPEGDAVPAALYIQQLIRLYDAERAQS